MDFYGAKRDFVFKVKYGGTLKRFGGSVHGSSSMDHDMSKLRAKIIGLFKFSPDADLMLTYVDEDGDVVTLDNDDELCDAVITQHLNPIRINVQLKVNVPGSSDLNSQPVGSTPMTEGPQLSSAVEEALKSVPEQFHRPLAMLSHDLISKAASSAPVLTEIVEYFSKLGLSNPCSRGPVGESSVGGASTHLMDLNTDESKSSANPDTLTIVAGTNTGNPAPEPIPKQDGSVKMTQGLGCSDPTLVDLNLDPPRNPSSSGFPLVNDLLSYSWPPTYDEWENGGAPNVNRDIGTVNRTVPPADQPVEHKIFTYPDEYIPFLKSPSKEHIYNYPINSPMIPLPPLPPLRSSFLPQHPYSRRHGYYDNLHHTFHTGVRCDGCGMHPIIGPRFKSNVKKDYDLCNYCFSQMGNVADFTRLDRAPHRSPRMSKHPRHRLLPSQFVYGGSWMKPAKAKLESRFIQDVTVLDGTVIPPSTPFTKIWRMHNNGTVAWPLGTQLVWIGGDQLGSRGSTELEITANGCPVGMEIDIAIDFTSPSMAGRFVSYWRMASPSGQKFGQRVWVIVQVENPQPNSAAAGSRSDLNLNLPPESSHRNGLGIIDVNIDPSDGACDPPRFTNALDDFVEPLVDVASSTVVVEPVTADVLLDASNVIQASSSAPFPAVAVPGSGAAISSNHVERTLLQELEEMGFKEMDLNKEVLRLNEYDLQQSLDDLCGYAEWDPLLDEMEEMGFEDKELNRKLLVRNGGSIKRAVLDLISGVNN